MEQEEICESCGLSCWECYCPSRCSFCGETYCYCCQDCGNKIWDGHKETCVHYDQKDNT